MSNKIIRNLTTLCALVGALAVVGCKSNVNSREYTFNMEQYRIKEGADLDPVELGKLLDITEGKIKLKTGGEEPAFLEWYDADGDKCPDAALQLNAKGEWVAICLNRDSPNYKTLKEKLGNRVSLYCP